MTDHIPPPYRDWAPPPLQPPPGRSNVLGVVAISLAGVGFLLAVIPVVSWGSFLFAISGAVVGLVGVVRRNQTTVLPAVAIGVGMVGWIISIPVFFIWAASLPPRSAPPAVSPTPPSASATESASPSVSASATPAPTPSAPVVGSTVTTRENLAVTLTSYRCGLATAGDGFSEESAKGQFCEMAFTFVNGGTKQVTIDDLDFTGFIGGSTYDVSSGPSHYDGDSYDLELNPGLTGHAVVYIDVPAGATLDSVRVRRTISIDSSAEFALR